MFINCVQVICWSAVDVRISYRHRHCFQQEKSMQCCLRLRIQYSAYIYINLYIHQVTACVLYMKQKEAYRHYVSTCNAGLLTKDEWEELQNSRHPMFQFWNLILYLELLLLQLVKAIRSELYVQAVTAIGPWMLSLDHHNYPR